MISMKDVVTMNIPFPDIDSQLARQSHMYVCMRTGQHKQFVKCQTFKPLHLVSHRPPRRYIVETPDLLRNPFNRKTTIDCDKCFLISNVVVSKDLPNAP